MKELEKAKIIVPVKFFTFTPMGLEIAKNTPYEAWLKAFSFLKSAERAVQFWIGDWINFGEKKWGNKYTEALDNTDYEYSTLRDFGWVAANVHLSLRNDKLTFYHYRVIAALENDQEKKQWIEKAAKEEWSAFELRVHLKKHSPVELPELPIGKFDVIYADPPWQYEHDVFNDPNRSIETHYPTLSLEEINNLKVPSAENAILFLWTPAPLIHKALEVMESWGFNYRTNAIWDKEVMGMGYWFRIQHEILLVGIKGKFPAPETNTRVRSVYKERRTKHSKKPEYFYSLIEKMYPKGKYLELFGRQKRTNWEVYGNEL